MDFPIEYEVDITQRDFIQLEILAQTELVILEKESALKTILVQTIFMALAILLVFKVDIITNLAIIFPIFFEVLFVINFAYKYFYGLKSDYDYGLKHFLLSNANDYQYFVRERGMITFNKDSCEYFTNQERRCFTYDKVLHIKETKRAFIFVLKPIKDISVRNFLYMVLPKRCVYEEDKLREFFEELKKEYKITSWVDCPILD